MYLSLYLGTKPTATSIGWGDPRSLKVLLRIFSIQLISFSIRQDYLGGRGINVWMDITRIGKSGVLHDIVHV
jgi:hypothetical protein